MVELCLPITGHVQNIDQVLYTKGKILVRIVLSPLTPSVLDELTPNACSPGRQAWKAGGRVVERLALPRVLTRGTSSSAASFNLNNKSQKGQLT
jgi:hypothetical protein